LDEIDDDRHMTPKSRRFELRFSPGPVLALAALTFALSTCGRTDLDDQGFEPAGDGGSGGSGGSGGHAGSGGAGQGGQGGFGGFAGQGGRGGSGGFAGQGGQGGRGGAGGFGGFGGSGGLGGRGGAGGFGGFGGSGGLGGQGGRGGMGGQAGGFGGQGGSVITPIPCGTTTCFPGMQACCVNPNGGTGCIPVGAMCPGPTIECLDTPSCGGSNVCCLSVAALSTTCAPAGLCVLEPGLILCNSDSDCNTLVPHCCPVLGRAICAAQCR
jgi:hypothetical protein